MEEYGDRGEEREFTLTGGGIWRQRKRKRLRKYSHLVRQELQKTLGIWQDLVDNNIGNLFRQRQRESVKERERERERKINKDKERGKTCERMNNRYSEKSRDRVTKRMKQTDRESSSKILLSPRS